ncbi:hypothetical protein BB559_002030 [Furculomyces boomerangus]|uniref:Reverse transcriptase zinc-binding domain-containing protein n=1 Tax=Furculomyces boomerangus TaxID=61424 RepID=A0A2T9YYP0_9FUNG|nr:hypothetical protein BB559_002030 [Furculomyces boomerangus]
MTMPISTVVLSPDLNLSQREINKFKKNLYLEIINHKQLKHRQSVHATRKRLKIVKSPNFANSYLFLPNKKIKIANHSVKDYNSKIGSAYLIKKESKPNLIPSLKEWNTAAGHEISLWLWKDVHKMKVLPKVKAFIWLLYNNGVYSAKRLNHMNSKISPNCTYCGKPENLAYVF